MDIIGYDKIILILPCMRWTMCFHFTCNIAPRFNNLQEGQTHMTAYAFVMFVGICLLFKERAVLFLSCKTK